jgi:hypothetical protein
MTNSQRHDHTGPFIIGYGGAMSSSQALACLFVLGGCKTMAPIPKTVQPSAIVTQINKTMYVIVNTFLSVYHRIDKVHCHLFFLFSP